LLSQQDEYDVDGSDGSAPRDGEELEDDVDLDESGAGGTASTRCSAMPAHVAASRVVAPLATTQELSVYDDHDNEDPAAWLSDCPAKPDGGQKCVLQRQGHRLVCALDVEGNLYLRVRRVKCATHGAAFLLTSPGIFAQLVAQDLTIAPPVKVVSVKIIVTQGAFECDPLPDVLDRKLACK
jgi:hypothetical protein